MFQYKGIFKIKNTHSILFFLFGFICVFIFSLYSKFETTDIRFLPQFIEYLLIYVLMFFISFTLYIFHSLKIKVSHLLFMIFFIIISIFSYNTYNIKEKIAYQKIDINKMQKELTLGSFKFEGKAYNLQGRTPMHYNIPFVIDMKNNTKTVLQCHLSIEKCTYIADKIFIGGIYNVKYHITHDNKKIIFSISNKKDVSINFHKYYRGSIISNRLDIILYTLFFILNFLYIIMNKKLTSKLA